MHFFKELEAGTRLQARSLSSLCVCVCVACCVLSWHWVCAWTLLLSILTFALSLIGTFLVRSGILNSVHAFASDPSRGLFILAFLLIVLIASLFIFARKGPFLDKEIKYHLLSRETGILVNNWLFLTILFIVFLGTVYPIFTDIVLNENITVGPKYYIFSITPIIFLFIFAMIITPFLNWSTNNYKILIQKIYKPTLFSVIAEKEIYSANHLRKLCLQHGT